MYISEDEFENYAELILHLVALEKGDYVRISADMEHKNLVARLLALAYKKGAKYVQVDLQSEYFQGLRANFSSDEYLREFPEYLIQVARELTEKKACLISIRSPEDPELNKHVPANKLGIINSTTSEKLEFVKKAVISDQLSWIVVGCPTVGWARNVFPEESKKDERRAVETLWANMKKILRLNANNPIEAWTAHQQEILKRRAYLNEKKYKKLKFISEGTDLEVALHEKSKWLGAAHTSENGKYFQANLPTEEVYTSPDCRYTEGEVTIQRPLPIFSKKVEGVTMRFKNGRLEEAHAKVGNDVLQQYINSDERNRYLGEIALVDILSPIWKSELVFNNILYDENAGVHFALGSAYTSGYGYGPGESDDEETLLAMGCNVSKYHVDFTFGNESMSVYGILEDGSSEGIMVNGTFISQLN